MTTTNDAAVAAPESAGSAAAATQSASAKPAVLLELTGISASYGDLQALFDISLEVRTGEIVTLIGANGAGKSTTLRVIFGSVRATSGTVQFDGHSILGKPSHTMPERGISHVPENRQLFPHMTVEENLDLGAYNRRSRARSREALDEQLELFPKLKERRRQLAGTLSGGEQQMVAIARGLMAAPRLLLLDEPSLGLSPKVTEEVFVRIQEIRKRGVTVLLVEQNVVDGLSISDRGYVVENGRVTMQGAAHDLLHDDKIRAASWACSACTALGAPSLPPTTVCQILPPERAAR